MGGYFFKKTFPNLVIISWMLDLAGCDVNLALQKPASQSSTEPSDLLTSQASNAVDGSMNGNRINGSCAHTDQNFASVAQWWMVDLLKESSIKSVHILYRQDMYTQNFGNFVIETFWSNPTVFPNAVATLCYHYTGISFPGNATLPCSYPVLGRFVRIRKILPSPYLVLQMCEVMVFGTPVPRFSDEHMYINCPYLNRALQEVAATYLNANVVSTYGSQTKIECVNKCLSREGCQGFNYSPTTSSCVIVLETLDTDLITSNNLWTLYHM